MRTLLLLFAFGLLAVSAHTKEKEKIILPEFVYGREAFLDSLGNHLLRAPRQIHDSCIRGDVILSFVIKADGTIDSIHTIHSVHPLLDQHSYKFLFNMNGLWKPGSVNNVAADMRQNITFKYSLWQKAIFTSAYNLVVDFFTKHIMIDPLMSAWLQDCMQGDDYYKIGLKHYRKKEYQEAFRLFSRAAGADMIHLDAIDMLKKTSDILGIPCDVCARLKLLYQNSEKEIKRIRDQYCTKDFKPLVRSVTNPNTVYQYLYHMPVPKSSVEDYIRKNISYPERAKENCIQGTVLLKFVVNEEGNTDSISTLFSIDPELDKEAVRLASTMKNFWEPGRLEGKPVKVFHTLPVTLKIDNETCHTSEWYYTEAEKLYEEDKMSEALSHFRKAFNQDCLNYEAGYNYAAVAISLGKTEEACRTIRYLLDSGYIQAKDLSIQYCD